MRAFNTMSDLDDAVGTILGHSDWILIDQDRINRFAEATGDHQWIHVDPRRARSGPFGGTIAHGFLTLSLIAPMGGQVVRVPDARLTVNYGLDRVRFISPIPAGTRIRGEVELSAVTPIDGGVQVSHRVTVEREATDRPVCVADTLLRYYR